MYSQEKIDTALKVYHQCKSVCETIRVLGYPTRQALYTWIKNEDSIKLSRKALTNINTLEHPRNPPLKLKMDAIHRCFQLGEGIKSVSEDIGYTRASIYNWRKRYLKGGAAALMNEKNIKPDTLTEGTASSTPELVRMQNQMKEMQLEIDILKETIDVLKKDPGVNLTKLKNSEKAVIVDALKHKYSLSILLTQLNLPKSSYYYQVSTYKKQDKYLDIRRRIAEMFSENKGRYGYRRINGLLKREGMAISEKIVRRIMKEENLIVKIKKAKKYNSYQGELSPSVPNIIQRDFHMSKKGCSPDNSACEGLFGRLKNEMFYGQDWTGVSIPEFIEMLNEYLVWYNETRIKLSLGNMSPREYRKSLGLAA